jgi:uncharacterized protein YbjT (DUF2867 family)
VSSMSRTLVIGAAGNVGRRVVSRLAATERQQVPSHQLTYDGLNSARRNIPGAGPIQISLGTSEIASQGADSLICCQSPRNNTEA